MESCIKLVKTSFCMRINHHIMESKRADIGMGGNRMKSLTLVLLSCSCLFIGGCGVSAGNTVHASPVLESASVQTPEASSEVVVSAAAVAFDEIESSSAIGAGIEPSVPGTDDHKLVWSEEFNGPEIDRKVWSFESGKVRNHELQFYTDRPENARIENGELILEGRKEEWEGAPYTSASMRTHHVQSFQYGIIEMRARLPEGKGIWPAFWAMGDDGNWPLCGEIDIMELIGGGDGFDNVVYGTGHWSDFGDHGMRGGSTKLKSGNFSDDYHIFGIDWDEKRIQWFLDGEQFYELDITPKQMSEFHQKFWLLLNLAIGGDWPGSPNEATVFPQQVRVDWVRVFQR